MRSLAAGCVTAGWDFIVAGDGKSPPDYALEGCRFLSLDAQRESGFALGRICPERSYTRKNIGYLSAIQSGANVIVETDDDNHPRDGFWTPRQARVTCLPVETDGWVNAAQPRPGRCSRRGDPRKLRVPGPTRTRGQRSGRGRGLSDAVPPALSVRYHR
jgi:hypothetical protein